MNCDDLRQILSIGNVCQETEFGTRYVTDCLYPSFERVSVYVSHWGEGYRVTDGGGAARSVLLHGRDENGLTRAFKAASQRHGVAFLEGMITVEADDAWLSAAVIAVANASAMAAEIAVRQASAAAERALSALILEDLKAHVPEKSIASDYEFVGESGKAWHLDYAVTGRRLVLMKALSPHPNSIFANHTVFGDVPAKDSPVRFSVYERELKAEDAALMRQVAQLVPLKSVGAGAARVISLSA